MAGHPYNIARRFLFLVLAAIALLIPAIPAGCGSDTEDQAEITVFAAASLADAFTDIALEFETNNPEVALRLNFAGSQRLRSQLELGAAADVFASADELQMALLEEAGLITGGARRFATSPMAVIAFSESGVASLNDLAEPGVRLVLAHENVPAGQYSRMLLRRLSAADASLGEDFAERVLANLVSEETSVKFVEQKVVLGQADAGIVYRPGALTALASGSVRELPLPPAAAEIQAAYPVAVLDASDDAEWATVFVEFLLSDRAREILSGYGFGPP